MRKKKTFERKRKKEKRVSKDKLAKRIPHKILPKLDEKRRGDPRKRSFFFF